MKHLVEMLTLCFLCVFLTSCSNEAKESNLTFVVSPDYPPFEYKEHGELKGFDVDLAEALGKQLGKKVHFEEGQFSTLLMSVKSGMTDAAISTITITDKRKEAFDFTDVYYKEKLAIITLKHAPLTTVEELKHKCIAAQLGSTMQIWLQKHAPESKITAIDMNPQGIQMLKAKHIAGLLVDVTQAKSFTQHNPSLVYHVISQADNGYAIALKKGSPIKATLNAALLTLKQNGTLATLKKHYMGDDK